MDGSFFAPTIAVQPIVRDGTVGALNIAKAGKWLGHPSGDFELNAEKFDLWVERFSKRPDRALLVDYNHGSEKPDAKPEDCIASGWIRSLRRVGEGEQAELWADVEWTARAAEMIKAGEYKFCSPVFSDAAPDPRTGSIGPELISAALTNQPFQDHLRPVALSRVVALAARTEDKPAEDKPAGDKPAEEAPKQDGAPVEPSEDKPADAAPVAEAQPDAESERFMAVLTKLADATGADRATVAAMLDGNIDVFAKALSDALDRQKKEQQMSEPVVDADKAASRVAELEQENVKLFKQLETEREDRKKQVVESEVNALIAGGFGTEDMRAFMTFELSRDLTAGKQKFTKKVVPVGEVQAGNRDQTIHKPQLTELSKEEKFMHDVLVHGGIASEAALNKVVARRDGVGGRKVA